MGNRKKPPRQRRARPAVHPADLLREIGGDAGLNRMMRKTCTECGAPVKWVDATAAAEHGLDVDRAMQFIGGSDSNAEFWVCTSCDNSGVLGGATGGF